MNLPADQGTLISDEAAWRAQVEARLLNLEARSGITRNRIAEQRAIEEATGPGALQAVPPANGNQDEGRQS